MVATRIAAETLRLLPRKRISRVLGKMASLDVPQPVLQRAIDMYVRAYEVDLSECVVPEGGFRTFNEFFARPLVPGARPVDPNPDVLVSPADGVVEDLGTIERDATFLVKGKPYRVGELLGDDADAPRFEGGRFAIVYLSPRDYHRVHASVDGPVRAIRHVGGTLYPVNRIGLAHVPGLFAKNERVAVFQDSPLGEVATVLVGAIVVGSVRLSFEESVQTNVGEASGTRVYGPNERPVLERGRELGEFRLGSTVIVLTEREARLEPCVAPGTTVRVGEALMRRSKSSEPRAGRA